MGSITVAKVARCLWGEGRAPEELQRKVHISLLSLGVSSKYDRGLLGTTGVTLGHYMCECPQNNCS